MIIALSYPTKIVGKTRIRTHIQTTIVAKNQAARLYQQSLLEKYGLHVYTNNHCWKNTSCTSIPTIFVGKIRAQLSFQQSSPARQWPGGYIKKAALS